MQLTSEAGTEIPVWNAAAYVEDAENSSFFQKHLDENGNNFKFKFGLDRQSNTVLRGACFHEVASAQHPRDAWQANGVMSFF